MDIEVFSDLVCPWCFIGKRRLDRALDVLAALSGARSAQSDTALSGARSAQSDTALSGARSAQSDNEGARVQWRPFQLYPDLPAEGVDRAAFYKARFGADADVSKIGERIGAEASEAGITLDLARIRSIPNTLAGHRLVGFFDDDARQHALMDDLFRAYFCEGRDIGDIDVLADIAAGRGEDRETTRRRLCSDEGAKSIRGQVQGAYNAGLSGVPYFVLGGKFGVSGAQSAETMTQLIVRATSLLAEGSDTEGSDPSVSQGSV